jgi:signal transduction histidine kinase
MAASAGTVRARTTAAAVIVVSVTIVVAAVAMVVLLRRSLTSHVRMVALNRAETVADGLADELPSPQLDGIIEAGDEDEEFVQVLGADGQIDTSSSNLMSLPVVVVLSPGQTQEIARAPFEDGPFLVVAALATTARGPLTVIVGRSMEAVNESSHEVALLLAAMIPLVLLVVGVVTWRIVGRALAPVEAIRVEVEAISTKELHRRVPEPLGTDEIARLATTMNHMLARLEEGQVRQRRFVSDASHELRSPVTTIRTHAEVALSHPDGTSTEELAEVVLEEDVRLQGLIEDLLLLTKIDEGTLHLRTESVDLDDLLFEEAVRLRSTTDLRIDIGGVSAGRVLGDRGQLNTLVRNLTDNAARHAQGTISLSLREGEGRVTLTVDDDGDGIPSFERERIFDRFIRLDEARDRDSGGSGLGLAIVREVVAAHRATLAVLESPSGGARFEVHFPTHTD